MEEPLTKDTWILQHGLYRCGMCGKSAPHLDISEMGHCFWCEHDMKWYETKDGKTLPVKFKFNKEHSAYISAKCIY